MKPKLLDLLSALGPIVRPAMLTRFKPNCCIATCKILKEVFAYYGFKAKAFPVMAYIYNQRMTELLNTREIILPRDEQERLALFDQTGAWGVGFCNYPGLNQQTLDGDEIFRGHLVLKVDGWLVDGSLEQASRPQRDIKLPGMLWAHAPSGFFSPRCRKQILTTFVNRCSLIYQRLENESYRMSPNWQKEHAGVAEVYGDILARVSIELDANQQTLFFRSPRENQ
jgi:hypothetical protein